jgi:prepilin signal peptidase PulO-like enzyme (type II secretory pathway)
MNSLYFTLIFGFAFGSIIGSFLAVIIDRYGTERSFVSDGRAVISVIIF